MRSTQQVADIRYHINVGFFFCVSIIIPRSRSMLWGLSQNGYPGINTPPPVCWRSLPPRTVSHRSSVRVSVREARFPLESSIPCLPAIHAGQPWYLHKPSQQSQPAEPIVQCNSGTQKTREDKEKKGKECLGSSRMSRTVPAANATYAIAVNENGPAL